MNVVDFFKQIKSSPTERFGVIFFKGDNVVGARILSDGNERGVVFTKSAVVNAARELGAEGMTLVHNHPTGDIRPSVPDLESTYALSDHCKPLGIRLLDHLILGNGGHYSFRANGVI